HRHPGRAQHGDAARRWNELHPVLQLRHRRHPAPTDRHHLRVRSSMRTQSIVLLCALLIPCVAGAEGLTAKEHYKKGVSYYALQKFAEAALEYEAAFEMQPDPALLYNAAQAHRLAGNKQRAVALYMSFLRMFPGKDDGTVQKHIIALKAAIEAEGKA